MEKTVKNKIILFNEIEEKIKKLKLQKKKIVHCHGVFDLLHPGHLMHFNSAKKFGDILIVSVTSDQFVNKGFNRPYFDLNTRINMISELSVVDFVCESNNSSAVEIIKKIKPNIYCKGPDYKNFKNDYSKNILAENKALKKVKGKIKFTNERPYSSSKLLSNSFLENSQQAKYLKRIKNFFNNTELKNLEKKLKKLRVLVIGESIIDKYIFCEATGKSGKDPVLTMKYLNQENYLGGSLAICRHLSTFCKKVSLISYIGEKNEELSFIKKKLEKNIKTIFLRKKNAPTIIKTRFIETINNIKSLGVYKINDQSISKQEEDNIIKKIKKNLNSHDLIVVSDYGHGLITNKIAKLISSCKKNYTLNAQKNSNNHGYTNLNKFQNINSLVINASELRQEFKDSETSLIKLANKLKQQKKIKSLVVTQGKDGALYINDNKNFTCPAFARNVVDKVGSGDAMLAVLALCNYIKLDPEVAMYLSSLSAANSVESISNSKPITLKKILKILSHQI